MDKNNKEFPECCSIFKEVQAITEEHFSEDIYHITAAHDNLYQAYKALGEMLDFNYL